MVRYYHPSDAVLEVRWDRFLVHAAARMGSVASAAEIPARLEELLAPVAEGFRVVPRGTPTAPVPAGDKIVEWRHLGYGLEPDPSLPYASWRTHHAPIGEGRNKGSYFQHQVPALTPVHAQPVMQVPLVQGLEAHVVVSLPISAARIGDAQRTRLAELEKTLAAIEPAAGAIDRARAHADGIAAWNVAAHFHPHGSSLKLDWDAHLRAWLGAQPATQSRVALRDAIRRLVAPLDDAHATVTDPTDKSPRAFLPFSMRPLDQGCVVDASNLDRVRRGDVLASVDGRPVKAWYAERAALVSGSPQRKGWAICTELLSGAPGSSVALRLRRGNENVDLELTRDAERGLSSPRPSPLQELKPGVHYVDASRFDKAAFDNALDTLRNARGIIFDLRGFPARDAIALASYWVTGVDHAQWMFVPRFDRPFAKWSESWSIGWQRPRDAALATPYKVALIDGRTFNYAESLAAYFPGQKAGPLVGGASAGANGNVARATLPSGLHFFFTAMRVTRHDGSDYHREGLRPDEAVEPTLAGIAAGRDELLERAISIVEKNARP